MFAATLLISSCITNRKITYLQGAKGLNDSTVVLNDTILSVTPTSYRIQINDNVFIRVVTPDPQWSNMFNTMPTGSGITITPESANLLSYPVETDGSIVLPYAGKFLVAGKTLTEIKAELEAVLKNYITDAAVTVRLVNNYISVIGEVRQPGRYPIYKENMNIFETLAMAGDLNEYSNRQKIRIIRPTPTGNIIKQFSLTDRSVMSSEYYYVMPNDVIYAQPVRGRFFQMNAFPYTVILSSLTTFILFLNLLQTSGN